MGRRMTANTPQRPKAVQKECISSFKFQVYINRRMIANTPQRPNAFPSQKRVLFWAVLFDIDIDLVLNHLTS